MKLQIKNYIKEVLVRVPIAFIVGACERNDKLCGRYLSHSLVTGRISRAYTCHPDDSDDPYHVCKLNLQKSIYKLISDHNHNQLKSVTVHKHDNVFFKLHFGYNKHGMYSTTPTDIIYAFDQKRNLPSFLDKLNTNLHHHFLGRFTSSCYPGAIIENGRDQRTAAFI